MPFVWAAKRIATRGDRGTAILFSLKVERVVPPIPGPGEAGRHAVSCFCELEDRYSVDEAGGIFFLLIPRQGARLGGCVVALLDEMPECGLVFEQ